MHCLSICILTKTKLTYTTYALPVNLYSYKNKIDIDNICIACQSVFLQKQNWHRQHMHCLSICILTKTKLTYTTYALPVNLYSYKNKIDIDNIRIACQSVFLQKQNWHTQHTHCLSICILTKTKLTYTTYALPVNLYSYKNKIDIHNIRIACQSVFLQKQNWHTQHTHCLSICILTKTKLTYTTYALPVNLYSYKNKIDIHNIRIACQSVFLQKQNWHTQHMHCLSICILTKTKLTYTTYALPVNLYSYKNKIDIHNICIACQSVFLQKQNWHTQHMHCLSICILTKTKLTYTTYALPVNLYSYKNKIDIHNICIACQSVFLQKQNWHTQHMHCLSICILTKTKLTYTTYALPVNLYSYKNKIDIHNICIACQSVFLQKQNWHTQHMHCLSICILTKTKLTYTTYALPVNLYSYKNKIDIHNICIACQSVFLQKQNWHTQHMHCLSICILTKTKLTYTTYALPVNLYSYKNKIDIHNICIACQSVFLQKQNWHTQHMHCLSICILTKTKLTYTTYALPVNLYSYKNKIDIHNICIACQSVFLQKQNWHTQHMHCLSICILTKTKLTYTTYALPVNLYSYKNKIDIHNICIACQSVFLQKQNWHTQHMHCLSICILTKTKLTYTTYALPVNLYSYKNKIDIHNICIACQSVFLQKQNWHTQHMHCLSICILTKTKLTYTTYALPVNLYSYKNKIDIHNICIACQSVFLQKQNWHTQHMHCLSICILTKTKLTYTTYALPVNLYSYKNKIDIHNICIACQSVFLQKQNWHTQHMHCLSICILTKTKLTYTTYALPVNLYSYKNKIDIHNICIACQSVFLQKQNWHTQHMHCLSICILTKTKLTYTTYALPVNLYSYKNKIDIHNICIACQSVFLQKQNWQTQHMHCLSICILTKTKLTDTTYALPVNLYSYKNKIDRHNIRIACQSVFLQKQNWQTQHTHCLSICILTKTKLTDTTYALPVNLYSYKNKIDRHNIRIACQSVFLQKQNWQTQHMHCLSICILTKTKLTDTTYALPVNLYSYKNKIDRHNICIACQSVFLQKQNWQTQHTHCLSICILTKTKLTYTTYALPVNLYSYKNKIDIHNIRIACQSVFLQKQNWHTQHMHCLSICILTKTKLTYTTYALPVNLYSYKNKIDIHNICIACQSVFLQKQNWHTQHMHCLSICILTKTKLTYTTYALPVNLYSYKNKIDIHNIRIACQSVFLQKQNWHTQHTHCLSICILTKTKLTYTTYALPVNLYSYKNKIDIHNIRIACQSVFLQKQNWHTQHMHCLSICILTKTKLTYTTYALPVNLYSYKNKIDIHNICIACQSVFLQKQNWHTQHMHCLSICILTKTKLTYTTYALPVNLYSYKNKIDIHNICIACQSVFLQKQNWHTQHTHCLSICILTKTKLTYTTYALPVNLYSYKNKIDIHNIRIACQSVFLQKQNWHTQHMHCLSICILTKTKLTYTTYALPVNLYSSCTELNQWLLKYIFHHIGVLALEPAWLQVYVINIQVS